MSVSPASPTLRVHSPALGPFLSYSLPVWGPRPPSCSEHSPENLLASLEPTPIWLSLHLARMRGNSSHHAPPPPTPRVTLAFVPGAPGRGRHSLPPAPPPRHPCLSEGYDGPPLSLAVSALAPPPGPQSTPRFRFLNVGATDIWGWVILQDGWGWAVLCLRLGLCLLDSIMIHHLQTCQITPGGAAQLPTPHTPSERVLGLPW